MRSALAATAALTLLVTACSGTESSTSGSQPAATTYSDPVGTDPASTSNTTTSSSPSTSSSPGSTGSTGSTGATTSTSSAAPSATPRSTKASTGGSVVPEPRDNSRPTQVAATPGKGCVPTRVDVPSVGISEPIVAMGTNSQGQIYPPAKTTMWYNKSPQPGQNGVAVVAGHVTYDGPDDFYELDRVAMGASVVVTCSNGRSLRWKVTAKQSVVKTDLQTDQRVWGGSDSPVVALITCDRSSKMVANHYLNNYVVWVRPA